MLVNYIFYFEKFNVWVGCRGLLRKEMIKSYFQDREHPLTNITHFRVVFQVMVKNVI